MIPNLIPCEIATAVVRPVAVHFFIHKSKRQSIVQSYQICLSLALQHCILDSRPRCSRIEVYRTHHSRNTNHLNILHTQQRME